MSIYLNLLKSAINGKRYNIDLNEKNLWIGKKQYVKDGESCVDDELINESDLACDEIMYDCINARENPWEVVSNLYQTFKHSAPNGKWKDRSYFKSLPIEELSDSELAYGLDRYCAQAMLEGYILLAGLQGWIVWQNEEHWFWQDENDKELVVLRQHIERGGN